MRDLSMLQMVNLAYSGGEKAKEVQNRMLNEYFALEGIDRRQQEIEANWAWLRMKKSG